MYSQTCVQRPTLGPLKVAVVVRLTLFWGHSGIIMSNWDTKIVIVVGRWSLTQVWLYPIHFVIRKLAVPKDTDSSRIMRLRTLKKLWSKWTDSNLPDDRSKLVTWLKKLATRPCLTLATETSIMKSWTGKKILKYLPFVIVNTPNTYVLLATFSIL